MIKKTHALIAISITTMALISGTYLLDDSTSNQTTVSQQKRFFPGLDKKLDSISKIQISHQQTTFDLIKTAQGWQVPALQNFPADPQKVNEMLFGFAEIMPTAKKTTNPKYFYRLHLQDAALKDAQSTEVVLADKAATPVASLLIGKSKAAAQDELSQHFVRIPGQNQSWLTIGALPDYVMPLDWVNTEITRIDETNIKRIELKPKTKSKLTIVRNSSDEKLQLTNLKPKQKLSSQYSVDFVGQMLGGLSFDDVIKRENLPQTSPEHSAKLITFDGLEYHFQTQRDSRNKSYLLVSAKAINPEDALQKNKANTFNQRNKTWAYKLSDFQLKEFDKGIDDFIDKS